MNDNEALSKNERLLFAGLFIAISLLIGIDIVSDYKEGGSSFHMFIELVVAAFSGIGALVLLSRHLKSQKKLLETQENLSRVEAEAQIWKEESEKHVKGLSQAIDAQLTRWNLSESEKEVALLLLKGLSLKEIAEIRKTTEKTARAQSSAVYEKSGLTGRSELSAFFLEDLLLPSTSIKDPKTASVKENMTKLML